MLYSPYMLEEKQGGEFANVERDYHRSVRVVGLRPKLLHAAFFAWALLDAALIIFFLVNVVAYVVSGSFAELRDIATIGQNAGALHDVSLARAAKPMLLGEVHVLARDTGSYDMYAEVENPNAEWYATFDYYFTAGTVHTARTEGSLMPSESRYLLGLNAASDKRPTGADLVVENFVWHRVDRHAIANTAEFLAARSNFVVDASSYSVDVELKDKSIGRSLVTLRNASAYSYGEPAFVVLLKRSGVVVGVNQVTLSNYYTSETREVNVHWFGAVPTSGSVEVVPVINYFDESMYLDPPGEISEDLRDSLEE